MLSRPTTSRARPMLKRSRFVEPARSQLPAIKPVLKTRLTAAASEVSAETPDWSREACTASQWAPSRQLLSTIRDYQAARKSGGIQGEARAKLAVLRHRFWSAICGADVPLNSQLGGGLMLPHPTGVVIHPHAKIGPNCMLFQQVTIGTGPKPGVPTLAGHVDVGAGARILGGVKIGEHVVIGANAVVISDVPNGASVPALSKY